MARETSCQGRLLMREQELLLELAVVDMAVVEDATVVMGVQVRWCCCDPDREKERDRDRERGILRYTYRHAGRERSNEL